MLRFSNRSVVLSFSNDNTDFALQSHYTWVIILSLDVFLVYKDLCTEVLNDAVIWLFSTIDHVFLRKI